jgi:hypothetical protein
LDTDDGDIGIDLDTGEPFCLPHSGLEIADLID